MRKLYFFFFCLLLSVLSIAKAATLALNLQPIQQSMLPSPYDVLLTQPLMTKAIETYYERTAIIQKIQVMKSMDNNTYERVIVMLIDNNKVRNNPRLAQRKQEAQLVEFAFITINFKALPKKVIEDVLNTNIPFGQLLVAHHLQTVSKNRSYFVTQCNKELAQQLHCHPKETLYGRRNTIVRADNKKWLAQVVEIVPKFEGGTSVMFRK